jgi:hypothetical protein
MEELRNRDVRIVWAWTTQEGSEGHDDTNGVDDPSARVPRAV